LKKNYTFIESRSACKIFCGLIILTFLSFAGCGGGNSSIYSFDYPLTNETAKSKTSKLSVKMPSGWYTADDNENNFIELWLVKNDYSATLSFIPLNMDQETLKEDTGKSELETAISTSKTFKKAKYSSTLKAITNEEIFTIDTNQYGAYEYTDSQNRLVRVVVLKYNNRYYELTALPVKNQDAQELYKIQNSILSTLK
jgi:hypothetical protein